jgi:amino acid transporter
MLLASGDLNLTLESTAPFQDLVSRLSGPGASRLISAGIALSVFNACIVNILMTARFLYSTARDGFWGRRFGQRLSTISKTQATPWIASLLVGILSVVACFAPLNLLLVLTGTGLIAVYFMLCIAVTVGRLKSLTHFAEFKIPFFPVPTIIGMIALLGIGFANRQDPELGRPSLKINALECLLATILYFTVRYVRHDAPMNIVDPEES